MKLPLVKTLVMALIAMIASAVAASFYPWPEPVVESEIVGKPLFESYDTTAVRSIRITRFNDDLNGLDRMILRRSGEKWVVPERKKFIASNALQIAAAANSLNEVVVLDEKTDEQQAYLEYGVVDPDEYQNTPNRSALGTKIILDDRNGKSLASLIIGTPLKDDPRRLKHFVRIPGQPSVYVIDFNPLALSTDFKDWVDSNLFQLSNRMPVNEILIDDYRFDEKSGPQSRRSIYRAAISVDQQGLRLASVKSPDGDGEPVEIEVTPELNQQVQVVSGQLANIQFSNVLRKNSELAKVMRSPDKKNIASSQFDLLKPLGFFKAGFEMATFDFESVGGEVSVTTADGLVTTLYIGTIAAKTNADELELSYNVMLVAGVDESILPEPVKPEPNDDPEIAEKEEKEYLRKIEQRKEAIKAVQVRASEANQRHADWIYIVSENVIENIRPDLDLSSTAAANRVRDESSTRPADTEQSPTENAPSGQ